MNQSLGKKFNFASLMMFVLPTITMMVVMSLYTIVDGIFISRFVSTNALSSTNIVYPAINVILGAAIMLSTGSNAIIAKRLGEGDTAGARHAFTEIIIASLVFGVVIAILGNIFIYPLVRILGASPVLVKDCVSYLSILLWACPAFILQILFQTFFVTEGRPGLGLLLTLSAGIVNAIFDYILIVPMGMGVNGAAIATAMGYMVPAVFGIIYFSVSRRSLYLAKPVWSWKMLLDSCENGSSEMVSNISSGIITFLFNLLLMIYAGEDGVAAITIIQYSQFLLSAVFIGFSQGIAPVISFNYGSRNDKQLKLIFRSSILFLTVFSLVTFAAALLLGENIVAVFAGKGTNVYTLALNGFYLFSLSFLFSGFNIYASALFTAFSNGRVSAIISMVRTFVLIVISLLILPKLLGLTGIWLAVPVAELGCIFLSLWYTLRYRKTYGYL